MDTLCDTNGPYKYFSEISKRLFIEKKRSEEEIFATFLLFESKLEKPSTPFTATLLNLAKSDLYKPFFFEGKNCVQLNWQVEFMERAKEYRALSSLHKLGSDFASQVEVDFHEILNSVNLTSEPKTFVLMEYQSMLSLVWVIIHFLDISLKALTAKYQESETQKITKALVPGLECFE